MRIIFYIILLLTISFSGFTQNAPRIIKIENKFGLFDENGEAVLSVIYDTIYSSIPNHEREAYTLTSVSPVFVFKKDGKYGLTYYVSLDTLSNFKKIPREDRYWKIEVPIYDSIEEVGFSYDYYSDTIQGFRSRPYYVFKYKLNNKWGLFYIRGAATYAQRSGSPVSDTPGLLGLLEKSKPIFEEIEKIIGYSIYSVKLNGKSTLLQVLSAPSDLGVRRIYDENNKFVADKVTPLMWVDRTFTESFDTIVPLGKNPIYFNVRKNNKWGTVKLRDNGGLNQIAPCLYDSPLKAHGGLYAYTDSSTVIYDYRKSGKIIELKLVKDKDYKDDTRRFNFIFKYFCFFIFESKFEYPDCINSGTGEVRYYNAYNIVVVDTISNQVIKSFISSKDTLYSFYSNTQYSSEKDIIGILIGKKVKSETGLIEYFQDFESDELKFSIDLSREGYENCHCYSNRLYECCDNMPVVNYKERKNGERKKVYVGYYNFETKTYKKGKCQSCR